VPISHPPQTVCNGLTGPLANSPTGTERDQQWCVSYKVKRLLDILWGLSALIVIVGSLLPARSAAMESLARLPVNDKVEHFGAYAVLAFLPALHRRGRALSAFLISTLVLGIALEFGQFYSPGRSFDLWDMAADAGGTIAGLCVALLFRNLPAGRLVS
jgi:VanZ family protein